jgi:hypothetical protein
MYSQPAATPAGKLALNAGVFVLAFHPPLNCTALVNALLTEITPLLIVIVVLSILTPPNTLVVAVGNV